ncbi:hypothetical protein DFH08DRAFT_698579 [Mycena albidolilacea]|uniref:Uncharacterized protein n=1 Tax=Mycena albidolilacea TaxID=1033008 RepID=A0AAD7ET78_9AGAR|nr:hypothetical protein DFH08DRAFT_698579 [Mycena albidolilacea]
MGTAEDNPQDETAASEASSAPREPFELGVHDIIAARDLLLIFLPPELVYITLDLAEYWAQIKPARAQAVQLSASQSAAANVSLCYLVLPAILEHEQSADSDPNLKIHVKARRVQFIIVSHDQGWCSDPAAGGTYRGSTWFESAILRPSQAQASTRSPFRLPSSRSNLNFNAHSASWLNRLGASPVGLETTLGYDPILEVANTAAHGEGSSRWKVQSNFCASNDHREHVVTWDADGSLVQGTARALLPLSYLETGLRLSPE